jgi:predicted Zn-dependent protease
MPAFYRIIATGLAVIACTAPAKSQFPNPIKLTKPSTSVGEAKSSTPSSKGDGAMSGLKSVSSGLSGKTESDAEEVALGEQLAAKLVGGMKLVKQQDLQRYVNSVGMYVVNQGERPSLPWHFAVVDSDSVNAFALPGGIVLVSSGLYRLLQSEDELAAVLAHEVAHVQRRHHYKVVQQQKVVGGIGQVASSELGKNSKIADTLISRATEVIARGLDKNAEYEADRDGMVLAARAGYDATAILDVLEKLASISSGQAGGSLLFSTHPTPGARLEALSQAVTEEIDLAANPSAAAKRIQQFALK